MKDNPEQIPEEQIPEEQNEELHSEIEFYERIQPLLDEFPDLDLEKTASDPLFEAYAQAHTDEPISETYRSFQNLMTAASERETARSARITAQPSMSDRSFGLSKERLALLDDWNRYPEYKLSPADYAEMLRYYK